MVQRFATVDVCLKHKYTKFEASLKKFASSGADNVAAIATACDDVTLIFTFCFVLLIDSISVDEIISCCLIFLISYCDKGSRTTKFIFLLRYRCFKRLSNANAVALHTEISARMFGHFFRAMKRNTSA